MAPKGGVVMKEVRTPSKQRHEHYSASKAGNWFLAYEWNHRFGASTGVVSLALNPGSLKTNTWCSTPWYRYWPYYFLLGNPIDGRVRTFGLLSVRILRLRMGVDMLFLGDGGIR
jgi:NAD(P)-dependent dehydrogenase (short-subunit alcohol dehydrogenase family)